MHTILITGAASGIGQGLAMGLAAKGHHILVTDRQPEAAASTVAAIHDANGSAEPAVLDVCEDASIATAFAQFSQPPDVLINCAGVQHVARLEDFPQEQWDRMINIMLNGTARMTRAVLPAMRHQGYGRIITIGSIHSLIASPYKSAYVAAKHGLLGFAKTLALETADTDITINTICPSYVKTPLVEKQIDSQAATRGIHRDEVIREVMLKPMPKGVFITDEEILGTVEYLMSGAARNLTGHEIVLDGGWSIQ